MGVAPTLHVAPCLCSVLLFIHDFDFLQGDELLTSNSRLTRVTIYTIYIYYIIYSTTRRKSILTSAGRKS